MNKCLLIGLGLAAAVNVAAQQHAPQNESIRRQDLRADLFFVAGDSMRGRLTDTEENRATADFIRSRFERMGLKPAGPDNSYFQPYHLMVATLGEGNGLDVTAGDGGQSGGAARHLRAGQELYPLRFSASGRASGAVMFAGFGVSAPHLQYDDFNANLKGQIVLVLDHEPGERDTNSTLDELSRSAETARGFTPIALPGARVELHTAVDRHIVPDRNVVALVEGSDPKLKDEWVIVSAHYDHNGADATQIFNGADDNGSGTVALIEIAEAYALAAKEGRRPKRSVLFAAWNSEERGLLGAWAYTEQPLAPLSTIAAVLNMDMIGRNEEIPPGGGQRFAGLEVQTAESNANALNLMAFSKVPDITAAVERANAGIGLDLKKRYDNNSSNLVRRSDQWPFLQRGVPAIGFITGLHPDYHTQYDRPEKINYVKMEKIARLVHQVSWDIANADARPKPPASRAITQH